MIFYAYLLEKTEPNKTTTVLSLDFLAEKREGGTEIHDCKEAYIEKAWETKKNKDTATTPLSHYIISRDRFSSHNREFCILYTAYGLCGSNQREAFDAAKNYELIENPNFGSSKVSPDHKTILIVNLSQNQLYIGGNQKEGLKFLNDYTKTILMTVPDKIEPLNLMQDELKKVKYAYNIFRSPERIADVVKIMENMVTSITDSTTVVHTTEAEEKNRCGITHTVEEDELTVNKQTVVKNFSRNNPSKLTMENEVRKCVDKKSSGEIDGFTITGLDGWNNKITISANDTDDDHDLVKAQKQMTLKWRDDGLHYQAEEGMQKIKECYIKFLNKEE